MRRKRMLLSIAGLVAGFIPGCVHHQPDLKPPAQPEVLASPGVNDKRYIQPCTYPAYAMDNDPLKLKTKADGVVPARGPRPPGMAGMSPGGPNY
jgi:hypothetical protein